MKARSIRVWFLLAFLSLALFPLVGGSWYFLKRYEQSLQETVAINLVQITNKKYDQIDRYFQERYADISLLGKRNSIQKAIVNFSELWRLQTPQSQPYKHLLDSVDAEMLTFLESGNYYDLLLVDNTGNVLYSVTRESELGTNLFTGPYRDSIQCDRSLPIPVSW